MLQRHILCASRHIHTRLPQRTFASQIRAAHSPSSILRPASFASRPISRWYSDTASTKEEEKQVEAEKQASAEKQAGAEKVSEEVDNASENSEIKTLKKELEARTNDVREFKDRYVRAVADYRNLQDRTARERKTTIELALKSLARDLLPSIDNLTHALNAVPPERLATPSEQTHQDLKNLHEGVKLMETVLLDALRKHGLEKYDPALKAEKFDPNLHEAMFEAPKPGADDGTVFHTQRVGYLLNDHVLRAAQVGVVKNA